LRVAGSERQLVPSAAAIATMARRASMVELENIVESFWSVLGLPCHLTVVRECVL
jgi:hypothetical protein